MTDETPTWRVTVDLSGLDLDDHNAETLQAIRIVLSGPDGVPYLPTGNLGMAGTFPAGIILNCVFKAPENG